MMDRLAGRSLLSAGWLSGALLLVTAITAHGEDVVTVQTAGDAQVRRSGEILDYRGGVLTLRLSSGRDESIPSDRIVQIQTNRTAEQTTGDRAFAQQDFAAALDAYRQAIRSEPRVWMQREILAQQIWCYSAMGRIQDAGQSFLVLVGNDPGSHFFDCIPLSWNAASLTPPVLETARAWMATPDNSTAQLLGASWLLSSPQRDQAVPVLRRLLADPDPRVAFLAEAQRWRMEVVTVGAGVAEQWQQRIDQMPAALRAGPYFLLGQARQRLGDVDGACLAWLRLPVQYPRHRALAAEALAATARELEQAQRTAEANLAWSELSSRFPETTAAQRAPSNHSN